MLTALITKWLPAVLPQSFVTAWNVNELGSDEQIMLGVCQYLILQLSFYAHSLSIPPLFTFQTQVITVRYFEAALTSVPENSVGDGTIKENKLWAAT